MAEVKASEHLPWTSKAQPLLAAPAPITGTKWETDVFTTLKLRQKRFSNDARNKRWKLRKMLQ